MSAPGGTLRETLLGIGRGLRRRGALGVAAATLAVLPAALVAAWVVGWWGLRGAGPLVLLGCALAAATAVAWLLARRWVAAVDEAAVASAVERARGLAEGRLRGVVELGRGLPDGVSPALLRRSEAELEGRLRGAAGRELEGELGRASRRRLARAGGAGLALALLAGALGFAAPDRARSAWTPLLRPVSHLKGTGLPGLVVAPGNAVVERGAVVTISVAAPRRREAGVHWTSVGVVPGHRVLDLVDGRGAVDLGPVGAPVRYWVSTRDGAVTDTFEITPADPLLVSDLRLEASYPRHVARPPDRYRGDLPPLRVPEGTRLSIAGVATRPLATARLVHDDGRAHTALVDGTGFRLDLVLGPSDGGGWSWSLATAGATATEVAPLDVSVLEDRAPRVRITRPGADTLMPPSRRLPVVAAADDDYGVTAAELVFRRVDDRGTRHPVVRAPMAADGTGPRASIRGVLDAADRPLAPGEQVEYYVVVRDNAPDGQIGRSATYRLRLPDMAELRDRADRLAAGSLEEARRLADEARALESRARGIQRAAGRQGDPGRSGPGAGGRDPASALGYPEAREAREVAAEHEALLDRVAGLRERVEALDRGLEAAALEDPELARRVRELKELLAEIDASTTREPAEALRESADALDPRTAAEAAERLAEAQASLREQLEASVDQLRRVAAEQELNALIQEADEITARQEAVAEAMAAAEPAEDRGDPERNGADRQRAEEGAEQEAAEQEAGGREGAEQEAGEQEAGENSGGEDPGSAGAGPDEEASLPPTPSLPDPSLEAGTEEQESLEERAARLGSRLQALQQRLAQLGEEESSAGTGSAREKGEASRQAMGEAGDRARNQDGTGAAESGRRAAARMGEAARELERARDGMRQAQASRAGESSEQATREALELAQRQESLRQAMEEARSRGGASAGGDSEMRGEQAALQQGLQQMGQTLSESGARGGRLDPAVRRALERAETRMARTLEGLEAGPGLPVEEAGRSVEALNQLALSLLDGASAGEGATSPGLDAALRALAELAREQGAINGRTGALVPNRSADRALTRQLEEAARRQRGVGRRVGELSGMLGGREDVLGRLDPLSAEAESIARALEEGRLDPDVRARQERLFHRLLDAGRSLERDEPGEERAGQRPGQVDRLDPAALDPELLEPAVRYPPPTAEELQSLPPAYRRMILEYFDRLNGRTVGGGSP